MLVTGAQEGTQWCIGVVAEGEESKEFLGWLGDSDAEIYRRGSRKEVARKVNDLNARRAGRVYFLTIYQPDHPAAIQEESAEPV